MSINRLSIKKKKKKKDFSKTCKGFLFIIQALVSYLNHRALLIV